MNLVIFADFPVSEDLTVYSESLGQFGWKNRLVGLTRSGFLFVDERVARKGHYQYHPKRLQWSNVSEVRIRKYIDFKGALMGACCLFLAFSAFVAGWVKNTHVGPGVVTIPIICGIGGTVLVFGCVRNRIVVVSSSGTYRWVSGPLAYRKTLSICREAAELCRSRGVFLSSHYGESY